MHQYLLYVLLFLVLVACNTPPNPAVPNVPPTTAVDPAPKPSTPQPEAIVPDNGNMTNMDPRNLDIPTVDRTLLLTPSQLAGQVTQAVNSMYPNWVILEHGTYIVFDDPGNIPDVTTKALQLLEQHRPKTEEDSYWMYSISNLTNIDGWSVYGNGYGIYTYVYPNELLNDDPSMPEVAAFAKAKRSLDEANPKIVYTHTAENGLRVHTN